MIPLGRYVGRCVDYKLGYREGSDKQQIELRMEVQEGPEKGKQESYYGGFVGEGAQYTEKAMMACGWDRDKTLDSLKNNAVSLVVGERTYEGKVYPKIQIFELRDGCQTKPENCMSAKEAADFIKRMFGPPSNAKPAPKPMRQPGEDEDLPY